MIDPIKKYVEENREAFDHLEPPVDMLQRIQSRLKNEAVEKESTNERETVPLFSRTAWLVAASVLLALTTTYILNNNGVQENSTVKIAHQSTQKATNENLVNKNVEEQKRSRNTEEQKKQDEKAKVVQVASTHRSH